jgi:5-enolpyruvylshikimate-3-phosphate synthase
VNQRSLPLAIDNASELEFMGRRQASYVILGSEVIALIAAFLASLATSTAVVIAILRSRDDHEPMQPMRKIGEAVGR